MKLKQLVQQNRKLAGISQHGLALMAGLQRSAIVNLENNIANPRFSTAIAILNALGYDVIARSANEEIELEP